MDRHTERQPLTAHFSFFLALGSLASVGIGIGVGDFGILLSGGLFLPLIAVWAARHHGSSVLKPLMIASLLPGVQWETSFGVVQIEHSKAACLLALLLALMASGRLDRLLDEIVPTPAGRRWCAKLALVVWGLLAVTHQSPEILRLGVETKVAVAMLAAAMLPLAWLALSWRRVGFGTAWFVLAIGIEMVAEASVEIGSWRVSLGSGSLTAVVPMALFALAGLRRVTWVGVAIAAVCAYAIGRLLYSETSAALWLLEHGLRSPDRTLLAECLVAAMMGERVAALLRGDTPDEGSRLRRWLILAAGMLCFSWVQLDSFGHFTLPHFSIALYAGLALLAGSEWGPKAIVAAPLGLMLLGMGEASVFDERTSPRTATDLVQMGFVALPFAWAGALLAAKPASDAMTPGPKAGSLVDISALAEAVQRFDHAATWRAFAAVLVPGFVLWRLVEMSAAAELTGIVAAAGVDPGPLWQLIAIGCVLAFLPLTFIFFDYADRQTHWHPASAAYGAIAGAAGMAAMGLPLGLAPYVLSYPRVQAALAVVLCLSLLCIWMAARGWRGRLAGSAAAAALATMVVVGAYRSGDQDPGDNGLWGAALQFVAAMLLASWLVSVVKLHYLLARDSPREWVFGAMQHSGFWVRIAAVIGLPSSLWHRRALGEPPTWAFLSARPLVFLGGALLPSRWLIGVLLILLGHAVFVVGKRLAARTIWHPGTKDALYPPVLFLRSFEDDQFDFQRPAWQLPTRWFDLWSFRRNADEAMVDEVAQFGPVVALGQPGEKSSPFGALRHYATHSDWQSAVMDTARRSRAIVLVAGTSPGLRWEFDLLRREKLLARTVLLLHPNARREAENRRAVCWLLGVEAIPENLVPAQGMHMVALMHTADGPRLLVADRPCAAAYVVALRAFFVQARYPRSLAR